MTALPFARNKLGDTCIFFCRNVFLLEYLWRLATLSCSFFSDRSQSLAIAQSTFVFLFAAGKGQNNLGGHVGSDKIRMSASTSKSDRIDVRGPRHWVTLSFLGNHLIGRRLDNLCEKFHPVICAFNDSDQCSCSGESQMVAVSQIIIVYRATRSSKQRP